MQRVVGLLLLLGLLTGGAGAQPTQFFVRNQPVAGRSQGGEVYVPPGELGRYFSPAEQKRLEVTGSEVRLDGQAVAPLADGAVPLVTLARALGYQIRSNPQSGITDLFPPAAPSDSPAPLDTRKRQEYQIAAERMRQVLQQYPVYDDPDMLARIERVGQKVARASPLSGIEWHFHLVNDAAPNAACVGEGFVFITRGLMQLGISDDELAGVLGHEIAHGVRRHCFHRVDLVRELMAFLQQYQLLRGEIARVEATGRDNLTLRNRVDAFERDRVRLQYRLDHEVTYGKQDEEEADILGMRYAVTAGYSPDGLGACLQKLERSLVERFGTAVLRDDMSHPPVTRRLEILRRARASWKL